MTEHDAKQLADSLLEVVRQYPNFAIEVTFPPGTWATEYLWQALAVPGVRFGFTKTS